MPKFALQLAQSRVLIDSTPQPWQFDPDVAGDGLSQSEDSGGSEVVEDAALDFGFVVARSALGVAARRESLGKWVVPVPSYDSLPALSAPSNGRHAAAPV